MHDTQHTPHTMRAPISRYPALMNEEPTAIFAPDDARTAWKRLGHSCEAFYMV